MLSGWVRFLGFGPRVRHVYVKRSRSSRAHRGEEIQEAARVGTPIVLVRIDGAAPTPFSFDSARALLADLENELRHVDADALDELHHHLGTDPGALIELQDACLRALDDGEAHLLIIDMHGSANQLKAQVVDLVERVGDVTGQSVVWSDGVGAWNITSPPTPARPAEDTSAKRSWSQVRQSLKLTAQWRPSTTCSVERGESNGSTSFRSSASDLAYATGEAAARTLRRSEVSVELSEVSVLGTLLRSARHRLGGGRSAMSDASGSLGTASTSTLERQLADERYTEGAEAFSFYIAHHRDTASGAAVRLQSGLNRLPSLSRPAHVDGDRGGRGSIFTCLEHVFRSDALLLLQTAGVLARPWVLLECYAAILHGVPIVNVFLTGGR